MRSSSRPCARTTTWGFVEIEALRSATRVLGSVIHDRETDAALRISEERFRSVVTNLKEVVFQTDATGLWTFLNPAWNEITGFTIEESVGTPFLNYVHADDRELTDLVLRTSGAQAEQAALVQRYRDAAGVVESGLAHLRQAMAQGQITNLFEIVQLQTRLLATQRSYLRAELDCKLYRIELDRLTSTGEANR